MILKSYELKELNLNLKKFFLFYGKNNGLKNEALNILFKDKNKISSYPSCGFDWIILFKKGPENIKNILFTRVFLF